ncbi:MAG: tetratricopeptide repeat protein [Rubrivivax sp.]|nr:tetratricopeptide repeat protein [Rubrivivax sp.]
MPSIHATPVRQGSFEPAPSAPCTAQPASRWLGITVMALCAALLNGPAFAAPFTPTSDSQVLETVPARASDPAAREMQALRQAWRAQPLDLDTAVRLGWRYQAEVAATGDPRYMGYIQAALQPWWALPDPPDEVRVLRAVVLQFDHRFEPALQDLAAVLQRNPDDARAAAWQLATRLVVADYDGARDSCTRLAPRVSALVASACAAQVDASTGRAGPAAQALRAALNRAGSADGADTDERLWSLTRLAEIEERLGQWAAAEATFGQALALQRPDVYLSAAHADFLLDRGRAADVLRHLQDRGRADVLLLRLALAAKATGDVRAVAYQRELQARFDAARLRGDTSHLKEESRHALTLLGDVPLALRLARENWAEQKEPADARTLLEAALAARDKATAAPVLQWMAASRIESVALRSLAARVQALP